jgi:Tfp pilus assembly protein PilF
MNLASCHWIRRFAVLFVSGVLSGGALVTSLLGQDIDSRYNDQDVATNHINRGIAHMERGTGDGLYYAKKEFEFVIKMDKDTGKKHAAYMNLGVVYLLEDNLDAAIKNYLAAIQLKPDYAEAYFNLGAVYYKQRVLTKAEQNFLKAIELRPDYGRAHYSLGFLYLDQKKYDLARKHADSALEYGIPFKTLKLRLSKVGR